jgi:mannose-1-phosphate guanylyltransferase
MAVKPAGIFNEQLAPPDIRVNASDFRPIAPDTRSAPSGERAEPVPPPPAPMPAVEDSKPSPLSRLRAVIVWCQTTATPLVNATGRSTLDLPVDGQHTILGSLMKEIDGLGRSAGIGHLPTRLLTNPLGAKLLFGVRSQYPQLSAELHPFDARGTGGVMCDVGRHYQDDDLLLILEAAQISEEPLAAAARELAFRAADVSVFAHADQSPSVMMLVRCGCLRSLPRLGSVDLRTQGLPMIARKHRVDVVNRPKASGSLIETLGQYIGVLRRYHQRTLTPAQTPQSESAHWQPIFSLVEHGGEVFPGATLYDAVVLKGGRVEAGATVVRSVVGPGCVVRQRESCIDSYAGRS